MRRLSPPRFSPSLAPAVRVRPSKCSRSAFTLVEVVLAIGIVALAFVPVLGLLPVGVDVARQAIDTTVEAQITQQLINEAQQTDFSNLPSLGQTGSVYFDYQGNKTTADAAIYESAFDVSQTTTLPDSLTTQRLATVTICVLNTKSGRTSKEPDLKKNPDAKKFVVLIPDNGR